MNWLFARARVGRVHNARAHVCSAAVCVFATVNLRMQLSRVGRWEKSKARKVVICGGLGSEGG